MLSADRLSLADALRVLFLALLFLVLVGISLSLSLVSVV
jgi:hypothetical protein